MAPLFLAPLRLPFLQKLLILEAMKPPSHFVFFVLKAHGRMPWLFLQMMFVLNWFLVCVCVCVCVCLVCVCVCVCAQARARYRQTCSCLSISGTKIKDFCCWRILQKFLAWLVIIYSGTPKANRANFIKRKTFRVSFFFFKGGINDMSWK